MHRVSRPTTSQESTGSKSPERDRVMSKLLLALVVLSVAGLLAAGTSPATDPQTSNCAGRGDVTFRAADGTRLLGHPFGRGKTAVVLAHQWRGSLCQWISYARALAAQGYMAFAFDFRNHGRSQRVGPRRSQRLAADVTAAVKYVRSRGATKTFLVGGSMGGAAVLGAGTNTRPPVAGVVSLSAPKSFPGVDAARLQVPVLFLAAKDDTEGLFAQDAQALYDATASSDKAIEILDGSSHGASLVSSPGRARELVQQFLRSR